MAKAPVSPAMKKGSAELLILALIEDRARHGYEISKLIAARSKGALQFHVASLYPPGRSRVDRGTLGGEGRTAAAPVLSHYASRPRDSGRATVGLAGVRPGAGACRWHPAGVRRHGLDTPGS